MKFRLFAAAVTAAAVLTLPAYAEHIKSGPQTGEKVPGPFHPINVTGEHKGEKFCLFCVNGENPVAMVFAREHSPELAKLVTLIQHARNRVDAASGLQAWHVPIAFHRVVDSLM